MRVTAIVFTAPKKVELQSYDLPEPTAEEIVVRTEFSGISQGTEIWAYESRRPELQFPTIPGYQSVGTVEFIGSNVHGCCIGQRVLFTSSRIPSSFPPTWMGTHVSHAVVKQITPIPAGADSVAAAVSALPSVSIRGLKMLDINIGDLVVVAGQGLIGQGSAQLARLRGATVIATDVSRCALS